MNIQPVPICWINIVVRLESMAMFISLSLSFEIYSGRVEDGIDLPAKRHLENSVKSLSTDSKEGS